jgi:hypothetical protein
MDLNLQYFELTAEELREEILGVTLADQYEFFQELIRESPPDTMYEEDYKGTGPGGMDEHVKRMFWQIDTRDLTDDAERELEGLWVKYHKAKNKHKYDKMGEMIMPALAHGLIHLRKLMEAQVKHGWLIDVQYIQSFGMLEC